MRPFFLCFFSPQVTCAGFLCYGGHGQQWQFSMNDLGVSLANVSLPLLVTAVNRNRDSIRW